jgi:O-antigen/teichoic acid export membrane protein
MSLFIQAFRYAAEPFFFSYAKNLDSKIVYARVMNYFIIAVSLIFLAIMLYLDVVILLLGKDFRQAANVIPILLYAYIFLGIYYNLSVWFKLTNRTLHGAYMAFFGAAITIILNAWLIPVMGSTGSAYTTLFCYFGMMLLSFVLMRKYYRINYSLSKAILYLTLAFVLYLLSCSVDFKLVFYKYAFNTLLFLAFIFVAWFLERKHIKEMTK